MNRRSFLHRAAATAGAVCASFALELQAPEPQSNRMSDRAARFFADWPGDRGDEWVPTQFSSKAILGSTDEARHLATLLASS